MQALGLALASGRPIWEHFPKLDRPLVWAHVDVDLGLEDFLFRLRRLARGWSGGALTREDLADRVRIVSFPEPSIDLMKPEARARLRGELAGVDFCSCDALRGLASGDENASEFRRTLDTLAAVSSDIKVAFQVLHHTGHVPTMKNGAAAPTDDRAGRGTSALKDASGAAIKIDGSRAKGRSLSMIKPPGRTGLQWTEKLRLSIDDVEVRDESIRNSGLRVSVSPITADDPKAAAEKAQATSAARERERADLLLAAIVREPGVGSRRLLEVAKAGGFGREATAEALRLLGTEGRAENRAERRGKLEHAHWFPVDAPKQLEIGQ